MRYLSSLLVIAFFILSSCQLNDSNRPPVAKIIPEKLTEHGDARVDNYYWLNQRENPDVIQYLKDENAYKEAMMKHTEPLQERLFKEITGRLKPDDASAPYFENGYYYYDRYEPDREYAVYCRKKGSLDNPEEIMLDVNELAAGHNYCAVTGLNVSPDNNLLVFGIDTVGRRKYTIRFKNLISGEILDEKVDVTTGRAVWGNDNKTVFYTVKDQTLRPYQVRRHTLGQRPGADFMVYEEKDSTFNTYVLKSKSKKYLFILSDHTLATEYRYLDADNPTGNFTVFQPRQKGLEYHVDHLGKYFYIRCNQDAPNFKLMKTRVGQTGKNNWQEVIPHREDVLFERAELFNDYLVLQERRDGLTHLRILKWRDMSEQDIDFGEPVWTAYISTNPEMKSETLRYGYSSLTTPNSTFDYNMKTHEKNLVKQQEVLGDFDPADYQSERLWAIARDGVKVPVSLVYRKDMKKEEMPLLLYGYGSYGYSMNPTFRSDRLSLLDRGFTFAIAHIRGGQEMGRHWYEDGKLLKKKNTFFDFIDCGKYLIAQKYTSPQKLFAMGGSAGGLLMGAVINFQPDIFKGVIAAVPFVDVVTTMLDESIPLTTAEYDEWGNPHVKAYYDYMLSYSPYDNVEAKDYPALLVTTGLHDSQVQYWEPAKWVAKLRAMKTDDHLLILDTDMEAGHGGTTGRYKRYRRTALEYAFMLDQLGIKE